MWLYSDPRRRIQLLFDYETSPRQQGPVTLELSSVRSAETTSRLLVERLGGDTLAELDVWFEQERILKEKVSYVDRRVNGARVAFLLTEMPAGAPVETRLLAYVLYLLTLSRGNVGPSAQTLTLELVTDDKDRFYAPVLLTLLTSPLLRARPDSTLPASVRANASYEEVLEGDTWPLWDLSQGDFLLLSTRGGRSPRSPQPAPVGDGPLPLHPPSSGGTGSARTGQGGPRHPSSGGSAVSRQ